MPNEPAAKKITVAELLAETLEVFGPNGEHWCQHTFHNSRGQHCLVGGLEEAKYKLTGSRILANHVEHTAVCKLSQEANACITRWNDSRASYSEVKELVCRVIKKELDNAIDKSPNTGAS